MTITLEFLLWTVKAMQQMLNTKDLTVDPTRASAFHPVTPVTKSPRTPRGHHDKGKRDSGYGSDFSPASVKSVKRIFTFDDPDEAEAEMLEDLEELDIRDHSDDEDVFIVEQSYGFGFGAIPEVEENEDTDKEVEELLNESPENHSVSEPIHIHPRPPAPLPTPDSVDGGENSDEQNHENGDTDRSNSRTECLIASPFYHTMWCSRDRVLCRNPFRPIVSRSVGTQTPSPHCQLIREALSADRISDPQRHRARGQLRLRMPSDIESFNRLPDVIPAMSRDRSISLPDVASFHRREQEQHVGRQLRRISDAFNTELESKIVRPVPGRRRNRSDSEQLASSPLRGYLDSFRRIVSSSSLFQTWGQAGVDNR